MWDACRDQWEKNDATMTAWCSIAPPTASTIRVEVVDQTHRVIGSSAAFAAWQEMQTENMQVLCFLFQLPTQPNTSPTLFGTEPNQKPQVGPTAPATEPKTASHLHGSDQSAVKSSRKGWVGVARGQQVLGASTGGAVSTRGCVCSAPSALPAALISNVLLNSVVWEDENIRVCNYYVVTNSWSHHLNPANVQLFKSCYIIFFTISFHDRPLQKFSGASCLCSSYF